MDLVEDDEPRSSSAGFGIDLAPGLPGKFTWAICTRRAVKLYKARSRLYRSQILQANTKYSCESSRRDLHNTLLCIAWNPK